MNIKSFKKIIFFLLLFSPFSNRSYGRFVFVTVRTYMDHHPGFRRRPSPQICLYNPHSLLMCYINKNKNHSYMYMLCTCNCTMYMISLPEAYLRGRGAGNWHLPIFIAGLLYIVDLAGFRPTRRPLSWGGGDWDLDGTTI